MNSKAKTLALGALMIAVMAGALIMYNVFSEKSAPETASEGKKPSGNMVDFSMTDQSGDEIKVSDLNDKPVIINYWASWCPYCVQEMGIFDSMYKKYGDKVNFVMLDEVDGNRETVSSGKKYIKENGYSFPVYFDEKLEGANAYGISNLPTTILLSKDGNVYDKHIGAVDEAYLESAIKELLK